MKNIKVGFKGKKLDVEAKELSFIEFPLGLMFRTRKCKNLLFDRKGRWGIHSWFVFFDFLALWLDEKNNVVEWKLVKPFTSHVLPAKEFARLVEIPVNGSNKQIIQNFINKGN